MEIKIGTSQILKALYILSWIIFIGLCIDAGGFIFNTLYSLFISDKNVGHFWNYLDFSALYAFSTSSYITQVVLICIVAVLKAILFYCIVKILYDKKVNVEQPFTESVQKFLLSVVYLSFGIGLFSAWGASQSGKLSINGVQLPTLEMMKLDGAGVWFFMGATLLVIAILFKRGIEMQHENELTI
ncbi:MAG: DUF2975 domain-containing protein [Flavobacterium sp.]|jgi:hypothetical protein|uniref:DUF2975 domain-containing protein n=1 Tax=Flavobacterium sp. TaxID=239 RepID=UPI003BA6D06B